MITFSSLSEKHQAEENRGVGVSWVPASGVQGGRQESGRRQGTEGQYEMSQNVSPTDSECKKDLNLLPTLFALELW